MLFMTIYSWEPEQRDEVIKRRAQGPALPEGLKAIGEWVQVGGHRSFRLIDIPDAKLALAASLPWSDIGKLEIFPVMDTEEVIKLATQGKQ